MRILPEMFDHGGHTFYVNAEDADSIDVSGWEQTTEAEAAADLQEDRWGPEAATYSICVWIDLHERKTREGVEK